jgi:S-formylglutathione hydrolase FrmB
MRAAAIALAMALTMTATAGPAQADPAKITGEQKIGDRTITLTIATDAFAAPTQVDVILPTGYDANPDKRWPVTYVTAGTMNNYNSFRTVVGGVKLSADYPSIIVSPDGNSGYWSDWYNSGAFGPPKYETFVIDQLLPLVDARLRTIADRAHRLILGISMGGYGAMMLAARHPDLFAAAASLSGAVDSNNPLLAGALSASSTFDGGAIDAINGPRSTEAVIWHGRNPTDLAENLRDLDLQVRTGNGTLNPAIGENVASADLPSCVVEGGVHMGSISFDARLTAIGKPHLWKDYGPGCHTVPNFKREITDTLTVFEQFLTLPHPDPTTFDYRTIEPHVDIWGWHIDADPARALEFLRIQGTRDGVTLSGSGLTSVTTPAWYRGLKLVDVDGTPTATDSSGRLHFDVDLGPANTTQQYTDGATTTVTARKVALDQHAVVRLTNVHRTRRGLRFCVRALGGDIPRAAAAAGSARRRLAIGARTRCYTLPTHRASRVTVRGRDRFDHAVTATARQRP